MLLLSEIRKRAEGVAFNDDLSIKEELLNRDAGILDIKDVHVVGSVTYDQGLYLLNYKLDYIITLPSSRSMTPVELKESQLIDEIFIAQADVADKKGMVVLVLEGEVIDLAESVIDNILLNVPLQVLTEEEINGDDMPSGANWSVFTESQYDKLRAEKKKADNPFSALDGVFED
ncbi:YceD family protein [Streptococcus caballi]|uniref:YceD family protein n=1 Tax=Streptococcus caballi TaxID=439220 RepID=UPI00037A98E3|nr:YceD family protein [Streptococcus caballi]